MKRRNFIAALAALLVACATTNNTETGLMRLRLATSTATAVYLYEHPRDRSDLIRVGAAIADLADDDAITYDEIRAAALSMAGDNLKRRLWVTGAMNLGQAILGQPEYRGQLVAVSNAIAGGILDATGGTDPDMTDAARAYRPPLARSAAPVDFYRSSRDPVYTREKAMELTR